MATTQRAGIRRGNIKRPIILTFSLELFRKLSWEYWEVSRRGFDGVLK